MVRVNDEELAAIAADTGEVVEISRSELARAVLIYGEALDHAHKLYRAGLKTRKHFDFELSIGVRLLLFSFNMAYCASFVVKSYL